METTHRNLRRDSDTRDCSLVARCKQTKHDDRARRDKCSALHYQEHSALVIHMPLGAQWCSSTFGFPETVCDAKVCR